ncbi:MAG: DUF1559 domain-containing protein [Planctomycetaceae bacterium]
MTLPELAVVVGVGLCVLAVIAPWVLKSWEVSRQNECRSRIASIGRGLIRHEDTSGAFPSGQLARRFQSTSIGRYADPDEATATDAKPASGASWIVAILPHMGFKELSDRWDSAKSVAANGSVAQTNLATLYCPSRTSSFGAGRLRSDCDVVVDGWTGGGCDYAACSGSGVTFKDAARQTWLLDEAQLLATERAGKSLFSAAATEQGVFGVNSEVTEDMIAAGDGLAWVILVAERRVFRNDSPNELRSSDGWAWGGPATLFSTRRGPHAGMHYDEADSDHPGLLHVCMADSRVRTVNWNVDLRTWQNLGNFAQGSPLDHPDFRR